MNVLLGVAGRGLELGRAIAHPQVTPATSIGCHRQGRVPVNLTGNLLIAMPGMGDPRFDNSVVLMCDHSDDGAMGLIINKPIADLRSGDLLDQLDIDSAQSDERVYFGGPVETGRGFVLHGMDYLSRLQSLEIGDKFAMTATIDILEDIAEGKGPADTIIALGYSGWGPGQLEAEIAQNAWLTAAADESLIFATPDGEKWSRALIDIGVDPRLLSSEAGHA